MEFVSDTQCANVLSNAHTCFTSGDFDNLGITTPFLSLAHDNLTHCTITVTENNGPEFTNISNTHLPPNFENDAGGNAVVFYDIPKTCSLVEGLGDSEWSQELYVCSQDYPNNVVSNGIQCVSLMGNGEPPVHPDDPLMKALLDVCQDEPTSTTASVSSVQTTSSSRRSKTSRPLQLCKKYLRKRPLTPPELEHKRNLANQQERRRMHRLNSALDKLREVLPPELHQQSSRRLSKIKTLKMAIFYIDALNSLLQEKTKNEMDTL